MTLVNDTKLKPQQTTLSNAPLLSKISAFKRKHCWKVTAFCAVFGNKLRTN